MLLRSAVASSIARRARYARSVSTSTPALQAAAGASAEAILADKDLDRPIDMSVTMSSKVPGYSGEIQKMNLFTAINDGMRVALETDDRSV